MITGASDGVGKELALLLAKKGFQLVLIARTQSKLEAVAQECEKVYACGCVCVAVYTLCACVLTSLFLAWLQVSTCADAGFGKYGVQRHF